VIGASLVTALPVRATGHQVWWVAPSGSAANPASSGTGCGNPGYVGTTDAVIQTAIDGANAGDEVRICTGAYTIGTTITVDKDLTLSGVGTTLPVLDGGGSTRILDITTGGTIRHDRRASLPQGTGGGRWREWRRNPDELQCDTRRR